MEIRKRELYKLLNPMDKFFIIIDGFKLECVATSTIKFSSKKWENNDTLAKFLISAECPNPCFIPLNESRVNIAMWQGKFHFPLSIPKDQPIVMGIRTPSTIVTVPNNGDISTGIIIEFIAKGEVINPQLININTQDYMKINKTMISGEVITVNTNYGEKSVISEVGNTKTNILNYFDLDSTFLQLDVGDNLFRYNADSNIGNLTINVYYNPKYLGV